MSALEDLAGRIAAAVALGLVALLAAMTGLGFLFAALYLALTRVLDPDAAALATGVGAFLVALIVLLIARSGARPPRRRARVGVAQPAVDEPTASAAAAAAEVGELLAGRGRVMLHSHARGATATALVAGLALGVSPRLRRTLWRLLS